MQLECTNPEAQDLQVLIFCEGHEDVVVRGSRPQQNSDVR
jgi:hypothetical protein